MVVSVTLYMYKFILEYDMENLIKPTVFNKAFLFLLSVCIQRKHANEN